MGNIKKKSKKKHKHRKQHRDDKQLKPHKSSKSVKTNRKELAVASLSPEVGVGVGETRKKEQDLNALKEFVNSKFHATGTPEEHKKKRKLKQHKESKEGKDIKSKKSKKSKKHKPKCENDLTPEAGHSKQTDQSQQEDQDFIIPIELMNSKSHAPETPEEYERRQSQLRHEVDPITGRIRLIKGDSEILEEIVSRKRHVEINKLATRGDGKYYEAKTFGEVVRKPQ